MKDPVVVEAKADAKVIENMAKEAIDRVDRLKAELKKTRELLTNACENDEEYRDAKEHVAVFRRTLNGVKAGILAKTPTVADKIDDLTAELKEAKSARNDYLGEYARRTKKIKITGNDGREYLIATVYQLSVFDEGEKHE